MTIFYNTVIFYSEKHIYQINFPRYFPHYFDNVDKLSIVIFKAPIQYHSNNGQAK